MSEDFKSVVINGRSYVPEDVVPELTEKSKQILRHWREECGKLHSQLERKDATIARLEAENERMREALLRWQESGCPDCGGDCASANPPVSCCIMQETSVALSPIPDPAGGMPVEVKA